MSPAAAEVCPPAVPEALLAGLSERQRAAVTSDAPLLCVVAGAGSGKTTVLTRRVAWRVHGGSAAPDHTLVVTFTRKAAHELRVRLRRLGVEGVTASTIHAAAYAELRRHWADTGARPPALLHDPQPVLRRLLAETSSDGEVDRALLRALATELSWSRARLVAPGDYPSAAAEARRHGGTMAAARVADLLARYEEEKRRRGVVDLDDLLARAAELLESSGAAAEAARWRVRHLFVDEFQDVNPAQWRLLEAWRAGRPDLCVVGDPRQAIYAWNGSDPTLLHRLPALVPGTAVLELDANHRSTPQIVAAATAGLRQGGDGGEDGARAEVPSGPPVVSDDGPPPVLGGFEDEVAEAAALCRWLRGVRRPGQPWRHLAVLARTHARLEPVADALGAAGIPVRRPGTRGRTEGVDELLGRLRRLPRDQGVRPGLVDLAAEEVADTEGALALFTQLAEDCAADVPSPSVGAFLDWLAASRMAQLEEGGRDGVELATFHRAKGLQWPAVAVVGLEAGTVPIAFATTAGALAEERRLLYVALSRAERHLWCSWATRSAATPDRLRTPSPYLEGIRSAGAESEPLDPGRALGRLADLRDRLAAAGRAS
ncbi:MAG: ATP-dependent helicase [Acidobacteriota bacterium]|nr:ATP-dependent helicase [Acidobacteriota bacterium]